MYTVAVVVPLEMCTSQLMLALLKVSPTGRGPPLPHVTFSLPSLSFSSLDQSFPSLVMTDCLRNPAENGVSNSVVDVVCRKDNDVVVPLAADVKAQTPFLPAVGIRRLMAAQLQVNL